MYKLQKTQGLFLPQHYKLYMQKMATDRHTSTHLMSKVSSRINNNIVINRVSTVTPFFHGLSE